jgi:hypothetical protein
MKKPLYIILCFTLFTACQKEVNWPIENSNLNLVIVDGIITDENKVQSVRLYYSVNQLNDTVRPVTSANVLISNEDSTWNLREQPGKPGNYLSGHAFAARPGKNYTLHVFKDDKFYTAKAPMAAGREFEELQYAGNDDNDLYHIEWVADAFNTDQPAMWEILLDWSEVPGYENTDSALCTARLKFYTLPTLDVSEIFAPEMESIFFPAGTKITEKRYSLTEAHAAFLRAMLLETSWQGGLFGSASANVITNLGGGAFGFFGVCAVNTLYITVTP